MIYSMHPQVTAALLGLIGTLLGVLGALHIAHATPFMTRRKRSVQGKWIGTAKELYVLGGVAERLATYQVVFELKQFRSRITGTITATSDDGGVFRDSLEGRLTTEQDLCFTFAATNTNVHDFGAAIFHIHPSAMEMTGFALSNESSSPAGRVFVMESQMKQGSS